VVELLEASKSEGNQQKGVTQMATVAIRNTAVVPANETRGEGRFRSIYNAIVHTLEPYFGPGNLDLLASKNRTKLSEREKGIVDGCFHGVGTF
jgi:hypothetical protein